MYGRSSIVRRLLILSSFLSNFHLVKGQCGINAACVDCYSWCSTQKNFCTDTSLIQQVCRVTCKNCPSSREECIKLNCAQRCVRDDSKQTYVCACMEGFELDSDGRSCNDIDECERNSTICSGYKEAAYCNNTYGGHACTSCKEQVGSNRHIWGYYRRNDCCLRNSSSQCGKSSTNEFKRIVNGENAKILAWPWMSLLHVGENICGGTLISENFVLTAAHCVATILNQNRLNVLTVLLGVQNLDDNTNIHVQTKTAAKVVIHPNYSFPDNDVAIIQLSEPVVISDYVKPVCLPNGEEPQIGEVCYATGFGAARNKGTVTPRLQEVDLPIVNSTVCEEAYQNRSNDVHPDVHICAGYVEGGKDACQGDSGGPLVCQRCRNCDWYLAGVTSFGRGCARPGFYGVYSRVVVYEAWISRITSLPVTLKTCVKASWQQWGSWMPCSVTCGIGSRSRTRYCMNGVEGDPGCIGSTVESGRCNKKACGDAQWSSWTVGECSTTCGGGQKQKTRVCQNGNIGEEGCKAGEQAATEVCNEVSCPTWNNWGPWSSCSVSCGQGMRRRNRTCDTSNIEGEICSGGSARESEDCSASCWANWGQWGECSRSCNGGIQMSVRSCLFGVAGSGRCSGSGSKTRPCNEESCGVWSAWGPCSATCGTGSQARVRRSEIENRDCNSQACPFWESFGPWSSCSQSCNGGIEVATRRCRNGEIGDDGCVGQSRMERTCNTFNCNAWSTWTYGACTVTCGGGEKIGKRECTGGKVPGVGCVGNATRTEPCNTGCCPSWSSFGEYDQCPVTCGGGVQTAKRQCNCGEIGHAGCEGNELRVRECGQSACPGQWSLWTVVQECSVTCGGGHQRERRECIGGITGGPGCTEIFEQSVRCNTEACPPIWGKFGEFGTCSQTCGGGRQTRTRQCIGEDVGTGSCIGEANDTRSCNTQPCPGDNSGPCGDRVNVISTEQCCNHVQQGYCITFSTYMENNCPQSCCRLNNNLPCSSSSEVQTCFDTNSLCPSYAIYCYLPDVSTACPATCRNC